MMRELLSELRQIRAHLAYLAKREQAREDAERRQQAAEDRWRQKINSSKRH